VAECRNAQQMRRRIQHSFNGFGLCVLSSCVLLFFVFFCHSVTHTHTHTHCNRVCIQHGGSNDSLLSISGWKFHFSFRFFCSQMMNCWNFINGNLGLRNFISNLPTWQQFWIFTCRAGACWRTWPFGPQTRWLTTRSSSLAACSIEVLL